MGFARSIGFTPLLSLLLSCTADSTPAAAQARNFAGRWAYTEAGQTAELNLSQEPGSGRVTGTFSLFGSAAPIEGEAGSGALVVTRVGGVPASADNGTIVGRLEGGALMLTVIQPGAEPVVLALTRQGGQPGEPNVSTSVGDFAGRWEAASDDGTNQEVVELAAAGGEVSGTLTVFEHGYFSNRTKVVREIAVRGSLRQGALALQAWDAEAGPASAVSGSAMRRGDYLVLRIGSGESSYARPGVELVRSAEGSAEAAALARAITGQVYSVASQAAGRDGFVGGRVRIALCADGRMEYDASDLASLPGGLPDAGVDMGGTRTRRGGWGIVLRAGAPVVRAQWEGTGTSYSLTEYFQIRPTAGGATIDGRELGASGEC